MSKHFSPSRPVARLAMLSAALWLAGCSFIPTFSRPAAPVAESFSTAAAPAPAAASARTAADIEWQSFFKDARLKRLIELLIFFERVCQIECDLRLLFCKCVRL